MVKNPPCTEGDVGWIPGWGTKISHAAEQLNPRVAAELALSGAQKPQLLCLQQSQDTTRCN